MSVRTKRCRDLAQPAPAAAAVEAAPAPRPSWWRRFLDRLNQAGDYDAYDDWLDRQW